MQRLLNIDTKKDVDHTKYGWEDIQIRSIPKQADHTIKNIKYRNMDKNNVLQIKVKKLTTSVLTIETWRKEVQQSKWFN